MYEEEWSICSFVVDHVKVVLYVSTFFCTVNVPYTEIICKQFNTESMEDNNFQIGGFAFCWGMVIECHVFLHSVGVLIRECDLASSCFILSRTCLAIFGWST